MSSKSTFKCLHCNDEHRCDPRNCGRQHYCGKPDCRRASKAASQRQWVARSENQNYFRGADHCERVRQWLLVHPGYWRNKRSAPESALQDPLIAQVAENETVDPPVISHALQDIWFSQPALKDPTKPEPWTGVAEPVLTREQADCRDWEKLTQYKSNTRASSIISTMPWAVKAA